MQAQPFSQFGPYVTPQSNYNNVYAPNMYPLKNQPRFMHQAAHIEHTPDYYQYQQQNACSWINQSMTGSRNIRPTPDYPHHSHMNGSSSSHSQGPLFLYDDFSMADTLPYSNKPVRTRCEWGTCTIELDDVSPAGIRRHFREHHDAPRGTQTKCQYGSGTCRSESMLFENIPKHIAECHLKTMAMRCENCGNNFARKDTLKRHLNSGGCPALQGHPVAPY